MTLNRWGQGAGNIRVINILLVEDNEDDIVIINDAIENEEQLNIMDTIRDGEEAVNYLMKKPPYKMKTLPELILLDINLPKKDGFQVLREIKQDDRLNCIPIIVLTTSARDEDVVAAYKAGASTFIPKPLDTTHLQEIMKSFSNYWSVVAKLPNI